MSDNLNNYFDLAAFEAQKKVIIAGVQEIVDLISKLDNIKIKIDGLQNLSAIAKGTKEASDAVDELEAARKKLAKATDDYDALLKKLAASNARVVELEKAAAAAGKQVADSNDAVTTSYEKLLAKQLANEVETKKLNDALAGLKEQLNDGELSLEEFEAAAVPLKAALIEVKKSSTDTNRTLKNMQQEAAGAEGSLEKLRAQLNLSRQAFDKLSDSDKKGVIGQTLLKNIKILDAAISKEEQATGRFQRNVGNYSGALKILEKALQDVRAKMDAYGKSGEQNEAILAQMIKEEQLLNTLLTSQEAGFTKMTAEIKANTIALQQMAKEGLEGTEAYKALFAATAALKDESADLSAALKNAAPDDAAFNAASDAARGLIGLYGLAQSAAVAFGVDNEEVTQSLAKLQAAETALQSIEAIRALFKKENAVQQAISLGLTKIEITQTKLQTAAESKNIIVKYAAIVAQKALNLVMLAGPGVIIAVVAAIALLLISLTSMASDTDKAKKSLQQLNDELEVGGRLVDEEAESYQHAGDKIIAELEARFASEKEIRAEGILALENEVAAREKFNEKNRGAYFAADRVIIDFLKRGKALNKEEQEQLDLAISVRDKYNESQEKQFEAERKLEFARLSNKKANTEEFVKASQDEIEIQNNLLKTRAEAAKATADNDSNDFGERIRAAESYLALQRRIINNDAASKRLTPGQTPSELRKVESERKAAVIAAETEINRTVADLRKERDARNNQAQLDTMRATLEGSIALNEAIAANERKSYEERDHALTAAFEQRRDLLKINYDAEFAQEGLTNRERVELTKRYALEQNALIVQFGRDQLDLYQNNQDLITESIERAQQKRLDIIATQALKEQQALNGRVKDGTVNIEAFERAKEDIEHRARLASLKAEIDFQTGKVIMTKEGTAERAQAEKELADLTVQYQEEANKKVIASQQVLNDLRRQGAEEFVNTFESLVSGKYDAETEKINEQIDALEKKKQADIDYATQTITNENDRALAISNIEKRAQAQKEILEAKQRRADVSRAKFEKALNIGKIIGETALAVIHQLTTGDPASAFARALAVGAIGALRLTQAIAAPLPQYKHGKPVTDNYEGPAVWGDGGRSELRVRADGSMEVGPSRPQITHVAKDDIILPDAKKAFADIGIGMPRVINSVAPQSQQVNNKDVIKAIHDLQDTVKGKPTVIIKGNHAGVTAMYKYSHEQLKYIEHQTQF